MPEEADSTQVSRASAKVGAMIAHSPIGKVLIQPQNVSAPVRDLPEPRPPRAIL